MGYRNLILGGGGGSTNATIENLPTQPMSFRAIAKHETKTVLLKWVNPNSEDFSGVIIVRKAGSVPLNVKDGTKIFTDTTGAETFTDEDTTLEYETEYYYRIFALNKANQTQTITDGCVKSAVLYDRAEAVYLSDLAVGDTITFGRYKTTDDTETETTMLWQVADRQSVDDGIVTVAQYNSLGTKLFDAPETENTESDVRKSYGNNRWMYSNIRQWLNSDAAGGEWYTAQYEYDASPSAYKAHNGFLRHFTELERANIVGKVNQLSIPTADGGGTETVVDEIWLASVYEVGLAGTDATMKSEIYPDEQQIFALFTDNDSRQWQAHNWWLRTPYASIAHHVRNVTAAGGLANNGASSGSGVRAFCNLQSSILLKWSDELQAYEFLTGAENEE